MCLSPPNFQPASLPVIDKFNRHCQCKKFIFPKFIGHYNYIMVQFQYWIINTKIQGTVLSNRAAWWLLAINVSFELPGTLQ